LASAAGFVLVAIAARAATAAAAPTGARTAEIADPAWVEAISEDDGAVRATRLRDLEKSRGGACEALAKFAADPNESRRENAVRGLDDLGCAGFPEYAPYQLDRSPWVVVALTRAVERRRIAGLIPFLIDHMEDPRRVVDADRPRTIGEIVRRALRVVSARGFAYDPAAAAPDRAAAVQRWRRWYADHRDEPRAVWVEAGIGEAREGLRSASPPQRLEALRQLALIGPPAGPALRDALARGGNELGAGIVCQSDEPPRVTDTLECRLLVQNTVERRVALAPAAEARIAVEPVAPVDPDPSPAAARRGAPARPPKPAVGPPEAGGAAAGSAADAAFLDLAESIVDLAPGEILTREFRVGPVAGSGRYTVRAVLPDRGASVTAGPAIEASTIVRFEQ
jgi:hypothetical protein